MPVFCLFLSSGLQVLEEVQTAAGHFGGRMVALFLPHAALGVAGMQIDGTARLSS